MRRLFVVFALLGMMVGLDALKLQSHGEGDPLTLAAIGFVLLAAFALAELGARLGLPKVTGYLLSGVALGPFASDILSDVLVDDLQMFRTLALGLIATSAGLELDLRALWTRGRTLVFTIASKMATGLLLVGGGVLVLNATTGALGLWSSEQAWSVALIFAALSIGTSPAIAVAVASENDSKGPLTDIVLDAAVIKDVLVAILLALAVAGSQDILGGSRIGANVLVDAFADLGVSIAGGALLGGLLIACLRYIRVQMLLFVGAMVLVVAEVSAVLQLELMLVFIVAGLVVRNFSRFADALRAPLRTISLPVFIVFFTSLGAGIDLAVSWTMLPAAIGLCVARAAGYYVSARLGGYLGGESEPVRRLAWLGYLPQSELTLALVVVAASAIPELAGPIVALGTAVVAVNLLVGPVTLRIALSRAGELDQEDENQAIVGPEAATPAVALESPRLRALTTATRATLERGWMAWTADKLSASTRTWIERLRVPAASNKHVAAEVMDRLDRIPPHGGEQRLAELQGVLAVQLGVLDALPLSESVPLERRHAEVGPDDPVGTRWRKRLRWLGAAISGRLRRRTRDVPVRLLARTSLEPRMARVAEETIRDVQRFEIQALEVLQRAVLGTEYGTEANRDLDGLAANLVARVEANIRAGIDAGMREFVLFMQAAGAPGDASNTYRYSGVEREVAGAWQRIEHDVQAWKDNQKGAVSTLRFIAHVEHAQHQLVEDIVRDVAAPLDEAFAILERAVEDERQRIAGLPAAQSVCGDDEAWRRLALVTRAVLPKPVLKEVRAADNLMRRATSTAAPMRGLLAYMDVRDERIRMVPSLHALSSAVRPASVDTVSVDVRELKEVQIAGQLLPTLERALAEVGEGFMEARETAKEAASLVEFGFEAADQARKTGNLADLVRFDESVERAGTLLASVHANSCKAWARQRGEILTMVARMSNRMFEAVAEAAGDKSPYRALLPGAPTLRGRAQRLVDTLRVAFRKWGQGLHFAEAGQAAEDLAQLYRLRAGIERLDAQGVRALVTAQERLRRTEVPGSYAELFSGEPLRDPRLFVANREVLATLVRAERAWQSQPDAGNAVLVLGTSGTGKSSTLGVARLKVGSRRVVIVRPAAEGEPSLVAALAHAIGTETSVEGLIQTLRGQRSAIVVDDLHHWFEPTTEGVVAFEEFLALVAATGSSTFWIAAMASEAFEVWNETVPLSQAFASIPHLRPVGARELEAVVTSRHDLSGLELEFPRTLGSRLAKRILSRSARASFVRHLAADANGNLRRSMALWLAHARPSGDRIVLVPVHAFGWELPFIRPMKPAVKATLAMLVRHGALREATLARCMGASEDEARQTVRFLVAAGLVERGAVAGQYAIRMSLRDDLVFALIDEGLLGGGD